MFELGIGQPHETVNDRQRIRTQTRGLGDELVDEPVAPMTGAMVEVAPVGGNVEPNHLCELPDAAADGG
jgi:hypothetical protein